MFYFGNNHIMVTLGFNHQSIYHISCHPSMLDLLWFKKKWEKPHWGINLASGHIAWPKGKLHTFSFTFSQWVGENLLGENGIVCLLFLYGSPKQLIPIDCI
uniref:Uncharacterized protein n=1 Tax=Sphaerodactylus townsendi TaxID=933632 RepID=A0ACB8GDP1_9SAUR